MNFEKPFPWKPQDLVDLKIEFQNPAQNEITLKWYWEPFHRPGFQALKYAEKSEMTQLDFEKNLRDLSCPRLPTWINKRLKMQIEKENILGIEGEIKPLDPENFIRKTYEESGSNIHVFKNAFLPPISDLRNFSEEWQPELKNLPEAQELTKWLTPQPQLLKGFHCLKVWDQLELLESLLGVLKSSSVLNFTRIYSL